MASFFYFGLTLQDDCIDELICFQRDYEEPVPGCRPGQNFASVDYCVAPPAPEMPIMTVAPTDAATFPATQFVVALYTVGDQTGMPLGLCQGKLLSIVFFLNTNLSSFLYGRETHLRMSA